MSGIKKKKNNKIINILLAYNSSDGYPKFNPNDYSFPIRYSWIMFTVRIAAVMGYAGAVLMIALLCFLHFHTYYFHLFLFYSRTQAYGRLKYLTQNSVEFTIFFFAVLPLPQTKAFNALLNVKRNRYTCLNLCLCICIVWLFVPWYSTTILLLSWISVRYYCIVVFVIVVAGWYVFHWEKKKQKTISFFAFAF